MGLLAFSDIDRAIRDRDPDLGPLLVRYLEQPDPEPGESELEVPGDDHVPVEVPEDAWTLERLQRELSPHALRGKTATERRIARRDAFDAAVASPWAPPRLRLGALLLAMYEQGDRSGREALIHLFRHGTLGWGPWQGAKAIYKLAEQRHDAELFGVLAAAFDGSNLDVGAGTRTYLRRRAARYLRRLLHNVPELYPTFAVETLRNVDGWSSLVDFVSEPALAAWKASPAPLLRLLELADSDHVVGAAIHVLETQHAVGRQGDALRSVDVAWLARLGARPLGSLHAFVARSLAANPELGPGRYRELGLHDVVLGWLGSPDAKAAQFAMAYARTCPTDVATDRLVALLGQGNREVVAFAVALLKDRAATLRVQELVALLRREPTRAFAEARLAEAFVPTDVDEDTFVASFEPRRSGESRSPAGVVLVKWFAARQWVVPTAWWRAVAATADRRSSEGITAAMAALGKRDGADIGPAWIRAALDDDELEPHAARWLDEGKLSGDDLPVDWLKDLLERPAHEALARKLMSDRRRVAPARLGLDWLLGQLRSPDSVRQGFARDLLLDGFLPADFAGGGLSGLDRLWSLATAPKLPLRELAALYLKAHHPELGPRHADTRTLGIKPRLARSDYALVRLRPLFDDERADVRRLAVTLAREELAAWGDVDLVYTLAGSRHREPRQLGCEQLLAAVEPQAGADAARWLDGRRLFVLAESPHKQSRETALTVVQRAYDRVGSPERLAWLMESVDRDVRLFAVRLFWERHRPGVVRPGSPGAEPFADANALRRFLRSTLYGLPPGRVERRGPVDGAMPDRPLPASVAKRRLIEAVRDLGVAHADFARVVSPVLGELVHSQAKGEWQACAAALATLRAAHGAGFDRPTTEETSA
jgi:hypothetical protein